MRLGLLTSGIRQVFGTAQAIESVPRELGHVPVLLKEALQHLNVKPGGTYLDLTFGAGGHCREILVRGGNVFAFDRDPSVAENAERLKQEFPSAFNFTQGRFSQVLGALQAQNVPEGRIDGILIDCGCSSMQMDSSRGFALSRDSPLDMRMNPNEEGTPTAAQVVNILDAESLARIFKVYGDEKRYRQIAQGIVDYRFQMKQIRTTMELSRVVESTFEEGYIRTDSLGRKSGLATKVFMALRIFVNDELNELNTAMSVCHHVLRIGGRAAIISFHALEDRIVKRHFAGIHMDEPLSHTLAQKFRNSSKWHTPDELKRKWAPLTKPITPSGDEVNCNPRSRSALLRVAEKS